MRRATGDNNPALRRGELGVFKNREAEDIAEKREPIIVARNKHCYGRKA